MNKKGSVILYGMMIGLVVILMALYLAPSITSFTTTSMTEMNCSSPLIDNYTHATCIAIDLGAFWFVGALILIGGAFFTFKIIS